MQNKTYETTDQVMENGGANPMLSSNTLGWYLNQMKGSPEEDANEADLVSCLEFNSNGQYLATGDKGGRIVIFKRETGYDETLGRQRADYNFYTTFTSHEPEFDYLKSLEIEEKINKIKWLPYHHRTAHYLLSTNDKTIKLWRINERSKRDVPDLNFSGDLANASLEEKRAHISSQGYVKLPHAANVNGLLNDGEASSMSDSLLPQQKVPLATQEVTAVAKHVFANAHAYHINAISVNCDQETFLSSDDLRINLWNLHRTDQSFNIVDIKPANMEDLAEVITAAEFHPKHCSLFIYSSSKGNIRMCDMRTNALCDRHVLAFEEPDDPASRSFFSEIINSISDVRFSPSGNYMLSRDYLTLKVWDTRYSKGPVECYSVHEYFRSKLCALYENDCIFDKFECCWSPNERYIMTGSYNNFFRVFDRNDHSDVTLEASRENMRHSDQPLLNRRVISNASGPMQQTRQHRRGDISVECLDYGRKLLHLHWNPVDDVVAMSTANNLFILVGKQQEALNNFRGDQMISR